MFRFGFFRENLKRLSNMSKMHVHEIYFAGLFLNMSNLAFHLHVCCAGVVEVLFLTLLLHSFAWSISECVVL